MNHIFKSIYNQALGTWVAVPEIAKTHGKTSRVKRGAVTLDGKSFAYTALTSAILLAGGQVMAADGGKYSTPQSDNYCYYDTDSQSIVCGDNTTKVPNRDNGASPPRVPRSVAIGVGAEVKNSFNTGNNPAYNDSVAVGAKSKVTGFESVAIGGDAQANERRAIAIGYGAKTDGLYGSAAGYKAEASRMHSTAFGSQAVIKNKATNDVARSNAILASDAANGLIVDSSLPPGTTSASDSIAALAFGRQATAAGYAAMAQGLNANASAAFSTAIGANSIANKMETIAVGSRSEATGHRAVAIGSSFKADVATKASGDNAVAVGAESRASGGQSVANGYKAQAATENSIAIGHEAKAITNAGTIAIGKSTEATGTSSVALGTASKSTAQSTVAIGNNAKSQNTNAVAIGDSAQAAGTGNVAIGQAAGRLQAGSTSGNNTVVIGVLAGADSSGNQGQVALGWEAGRNTTGAFNVASGYQAGQYVSGASNIAIGNKAGQGANGAPIGINNSIALGTGAQGSHDDTIALGRGAKAQIADSIAIGRGVTTELLPGDGLNDREGMIAIGSETTKASGKAAVSIGRNAQGIGRGTVALGDASKALAGQGIAIGAQANVATGAAGGIAMGSVAKTTGVTAVAIGTLSEAKSAHSVALGRESVADRGALTPNAATAAASSAAGNTVYALDAASAADKTAISATVKGDKGAVSVGKADATRQIINLAAGSEDTDAVNVAQLKAVANQLQAGQTHYYSVKSTNTGAGSNYQNDGATGSDALAAGVKSSATAMQATAVGSEAAATGAQSLAVGNKVIASGLGATAIGNNSEATALGAQAFGQSSKATATNAAAVGRLATASGERASAFGVANTASGKSSFAGGDKSEASGSNAVAIGTQAKAGSIDTIAIGAGADSGASQFGIAMGSGAKLSSTAGHNTAIAIGRSAEAGNLDATAMGRQAAASGQTSIAIGALATTAGRSSIGIGSSASTVATDGIAIGNQAKTGAGENNTAIGSYADANVGWSTAVGTRAYTNANGAVAVGTMASTKGQRATGIGSYSYAEGLSSTALGYHTIATNKASAGTALGTGTVVDGKQSGGWGAVVHDNPDKFNNAERSFIGGTGNYAIGNKNIVGGQTTNSVALGNNIKLGATGATLTSVDPGGKGNSIKTRTESVSYAGQTALNNAVALGNNSSVTQSGGVALGAESVADVALGQLGADPLGAGAGSGSVWQATHAAVSVGNGTTATRQITSVAAGTQDSDAVNVAQLKAAGFKVKHSANGGTATGDNTSANVLNGEEVEFVAGDNITIDRTGKKLTFSVTSGAIAPSTHYYSVNDNGTPQANHDNKGATADRALAAGVNTSATAFGATAVGNSATASNLEAVAIGTRANASNTASIAIGEGTKASGISALAIGLNTEATGNNSFALGSGSTATPASKLAKASGAQAVALGYQTQALVNNATAVGANATAGGATGESATAIGANAEAGDRGTGVGAGSKANGAYSSAFGVSSVASALNATAVGTSATASAGNSLAVGSSANAAGASSIAVGRVSKTYTGNDIAIGSEASAGLTTAGAGSSHAIAIGRGTKANQSQAVAIGNSAEVQVAQGVALGSSSVASVDKGVVGADPLGAGAASGSVWQATHAAVSVGNGATVTRQITSVAAGTADTDAVNVAQLKAAGFKLQATHAGGGESSSITDDKIQNGETVTVDAGKNIKVTHTANTVSIATQDKVAFTQITLGDAANNTVLTSTANGLDIGGDKITNVAAGTADSDAVNLGQLKAMTADAGKHNTVKAGTNVTVSEAPNAAGGIEYTINAKDTVTTVSGVAGETVVTNTGTADAPNYQVALAQSVKADIAKGVSAHDTVTNKGLTFTGDNGTTGAKKLGDSVAITGDSNITTVADGNGVQIKLNPDLNVTSVTAGNTTINNNGLTINGGPSVTNAGIDAASKAITNVAAGTAPTDAVNVSQLNQATAAAKTQVKSDNKTVTVSKSQDVTTGADVYDLSVKTGDSLTVAADGTINVKTDGTTITTDGNGAIKANTTALTNGADGKVATPAAPNALATAGDIANAINKSGFTLKTSAAADGEKDPASTGDEIINPGEYVDMVAGKNMKVTQAANGKITYATKDVVDFNKVNVGGVVIDSAGNKISGLTPATLSPTSTEAVNGSQLYTTNQNVQTNADNIAKGINFGGNSGPAANNYQLGQTITVFGDDNITSTTVVGGTQLALAPVVSIGPATGGNPVTINGKAGTIGGLTNTTWDPNNITSGQAATEDQLKAATATTPLTNAADGTVNPIAPADQGKLATAEDIANAINNSGFTLMTSASDGTVSGTTSELVKTGETVTVDAGKNISVRQDGNKVSIATEDDVEFDSVKADTVTTGDTTMTTDGITINNGNAGAPVTLTKDGLNNGGNKITNVADGTDDRDAVNVSQLKAIKPVVNNIDARTYNIINNTTVSAGDNMQVTKQGDNYQVGLAPDIKLNSVTTGGVVMNSNGLSVNGNTYVDAAGLNANGQTIRNVAAGRVAADSHDAVNGAQLHQAYQRMGDIDQRARAGIASAMASAGLPQAYRPGANMVAVSAGHYDGQSAVAVGASTISDNGRWILKGTLNVNSKDAGATVGVGYQW